jgi:hypothetical protein
MLFFADTVNSEFDALGTSLNQITENLKGALDKLASVENLQKTITEMDDEAKKLQKTMASGMVFESANFREQLLKSYEGVLKMGGTFKDITESVGGLSEGMGKVVFLTNSLVDSGERIKKSNGEVEIVYRNAAESMVALSKSTGIGGKEIGNMVSEFMRFEGSQVKSIETMQKISETARKSGLQSKKLLEDVQGQMKNIDSYGFKNGVEGLTKMVAQAQRLRTSVDEIGALSSAQGLWDPEKAIETAANLQMLGGAIGDLGNPFKLMDMGMNDVGKLQDEMTKMAANAFKINEATGEIEIDPLSRQRLKEQAQVFGKNLEDYTKIGREAFKAQEVINKMNLTGFGQDMPKESKDLLSSLTEVKGGKMTLDIPGFKTDDLEAAMKESPKALEGALAEYQKKAGMSEKQIAEQGLGLQETMARDQRIIRDTLIMQLSETERQDIVDTFDKGIDKMMGATKEGAQQAAGVAKDLIGNLNNAFENVSNSSDWKKEDQEIRILKENQRVEMMEGNKTQTWGNANVDAENVSVTKTRDGLFGEGGKTLLTEEGKLFDFLKNDEAVFAPDLIKNLNILEKTYKDSVKVSQMLPNMTTLPAMNVPTKAESQVVKQETTQKVEASGDINININVTSNGTLSDMLSRDSEFNEKMKRKILNIIDRKGNFMADKGITR